MSILSRNFEDFTLSNKDVYKLIKKSFIENISTQAWRDVRNIYMKMFTDDFSISFSDMLVEIIMNLPLKFENIDGSDEIKVKYFEGDNGVLLIDVCLKSNKKIATLFCESF